MIVFLLFGLPTGVVLENIDNTVSLDLRLKLITVGPPWHPRALAHHTQGQIFSLPYY